VKTARKGAKPAPKAGASPSPDPPPAAGGRRLARRASARYRELYSEPPVWAAAAPGRVNLIGEHTDYNAGFVFPMALQHRTAMVAGPDRNPVVTLHSVALGETATIPLRGRLKPGRPAWANYVRGVIAGFQARGIPIPGFRAVIESDVPPGSGLSSSAALEVATATLLEVITGHRLEPVAKALLCQQAEHDFAGVPCGIMDQFMAVLGRKDRLLLLDCRSHQAVRVPLTDPGICILIVNTMVRHRLADGEYARRRKECETAARRLGVATLRDVQRADLPAARRRLAPRLFRRTRHVVTENDRTLEAAAAVRDGDWKRLGALMHASHASLRDDYEVSCAELDAVVAIARRLGPGRGMFGCRMTGGGFGGCAVALVRTADVAAIADRIRAAYERRFGLVPSIFVSRPGAGAEALSS